VVLKDHRALQDARSGVASDYLASFILSFRHSYNSASVQIMASLNIEFLVPEAL